ncbi:MAG: hypothetical protein IIY21_09745 [Clostridiales bacterium]|nr:hypothetical protein [Clostridiales bacterium]
MTYEEQTKIALENKKIIEAEVTGSGVSLKFADGTIFNYLASDGGYSCWEVLKEGEAE